MKVFEPIALGTLNSTGAISFRMLTGITMGLFPGVIGWLLGKLELRNEMALRDSQDSDFLSKLTYVLRPHRF